MDYGFEHEGQVFTPNGTTGIAPTENSARNEAIQAAELARWETKPDRQLAYYHLPAEHNQPGRQWRTAFYPDTTGAYVTLWPGARLGTITSARVYPHNFGSRMISIRVRGSNGAEYSGRASYDWGSCVNLRRVKGRS